MICLLSAISHRYFGHNQTVFIFFVPVTWFLNVTLMIVVYRMRGMIKKAPNFIVNESNFIIYEIIFGVYTLFWSILRVLQVIQDSHWKE